MHAGAMLSASLLALGLGQGCGTDEGGSPREDAIERARAATAKYRDVAVATADGFVPEGECVFDPELGAMGVHFVHYARLADPAVRIEEPEALLYLPESGAFRLVAIEHVQLILINGVPYPGCGVGDESCPPKDPPPAPSLYEGVVLEGPMAGHGPGMPWHYDLHAWLWEPNPAGLFSAFNPALSCE